MGPGHCHQGDYILEWEEEGGGGMGQAAANITPVGPQRLEEEP